MAAPNTPAPEVAKVDTLIDENGSPIRVPDDSGIRAAHGAEPSVGGTGPTNWMLYGIVALGAIIAVLLVLQLVGGAPGTDVAPGTPTAEPVVAPLEPSGQ